MADFSERMASLNTQMRFKRYRDAMPIAYQLRLDLQLVNPLTPKLAESLKVVEDVIEQLEKHKVTTWSKLMKKLRYTLDPSSREEEPETEDDEEEEEEEEAEAEGSGEDEGGGR